MQKKGSFSSHGKYKFWIQELCMLLKYSSLSLDMLRSWWPIKIIYDPIAYHIVFLGISVNQFCLKLTLKFYGKVLTASMAHAVLELDSCCDFVLRKYLIIFFFQKWLSNQPWNHGVINCTFVLLTKQVDSKSFKCYFVTRI